jgi:hypothetical protein
MIVPVQALSLPPTRFCRCRWAEHVRGRSIFLLALQIIAERSLLRLTSDPRKCPRALHAAQILSLSPRATIDAALSSLKSP